jgi:methionine-R-sulfoxide reductase
MKGMFMSKKSKNKSLTDLQIDVTQNCGTEKPFDNEYWDNKEDGIYVDINDGSPLFCSIHKFDSGSGWPSFYNTINNRNIDLKKDTSFGYDRNEVRSIDSDSHLGHVFNDGPSNKTGLRYCINSASLRFIPKSKLSDQGYSNLLLLFEENV